MIVWVVRLAHRQDRLANCKPLQQLLRVFAVFAAAQVNGSSFAGLRAGVHASAIADASKAVSACKRRQQAAASRAVCDGGCAGARARAPGAPRMSRRRQAQPQRVLGPLAAAASRAAAAREECVANVRCERVATAGVVSGAAAAALLALRGGHARARAWAPHASDAGPYLHIWRDAVSVCAASGRRACGDRARCCGHGAKRGAQQQRCSPHTGASAARGGLRRLHAAKGSDRRVLFYPLCGAAQLWGPERGNTGRKATLLDAALFEARGCAQGL